MAAVPVKAPFDRRRECRVPVHLPMLLRGTDRNGKWFEESTVVENLSSGGAAFSTLSALEKGSMIYVSIPASPTEEPGTEFSTKAQIVYFKPDKGARGVAIGVKFIGPRFQRGFVSVWA